MLSSNKARWDIVAQKNRWENFKHDHQPERPSNSMARKKLVFENLSNLPISSLADSDPNVNRKRKLISSSDNGSISKKQNTQPGVENKPLTISVSAPKPKAVVPAVKRTATLNSKLEFLPTPKNSHNAILSGLNLTLENKEISEPQIKKDLLKQPKYFTFSENHINLSNKGELDVKKRVAYKKTLRECIQKTDALIEQWEPGYIKRKQSMISTLFPQVSELNKQCEEQVRRVEELLNAMEVDSAYKL